MISLTIYVGRFFTSRKITFKYKPKIPKIKDWTPPRSSTVHIIPAHPGTDSPINFIATTIKIITTLNTDRKKPRSNENFNGMSVNEISVLSKCPLIHFVLNSRNLVFSDQSPRASLTYFRWPWGYPRFAINPLRNGSCS